jgi:fatty acid desaturase
VAREESGVVRNLGQLLGEALVKRGRVAAREIGSAATLEEEGVARHQAVVDEEALAAGGVTRRVDQLDRNLADQELVPTRVLDQISGLDTGDPSDPLGLLGLDVHRHRPTSQQLTHARDLVAHHVAAHMIRVVVGGQRPDQPHSVLVENGQDVVNPVGRVDHHRVTGLSIADQVDEVHHLAGQRVVDGDVSPGEKLAEVETVVGCHDGNDTSLTGGAYPGSVDLRALREDDGAASSDPADRVPAGSGGMVPASAVRPDVLPSDRLLASGKPVPELRADLRRIADARNVVTVLSVYLQSFGVIALAVWIDHPLTWVAAFLLMGRAFALFAILAHEAAHRLLFTRRWANDLVGRWLLAYPAFVAFDLYRRSHFAHHRDEMGPEEPDLDLYRSYPIPRDSMRRKLTRDAVGISGWKNLKGLLLALRSSRGRPVALRILAAQAVLLAGFTAVGRPELYLFLWLAPWMTVWRVINRLRAIAEHGGMTRSKDRRATTHHVHQTAIARFCFVPYNTGWHLAHHVDMGVPFRNLPRLHQELVDAGWVTPELEYANYRSLWRRLASG